MHSLVNMDTNKIQSACDVPNVHQSPIIIKWKVKRGISRVQDQVNNFALDSLEVLMGIYILLSVKIIFGIKQFVTIVPGSAFWYLRLVA